MHTVHFCSGETFATDDATAKALLGYARALAQLRRFDIVEVPTMDAEGRRGGSSLLIGPESQLSATALLDDRRTLADDGTADRLLAATHELLAEPVLGGVWE
jgi:hypothetical protein